MTFSTGVPAGPYIVESNTESLSLTTNEISWAGLVTSSTATTPTNGIGGTVQIGAGYFGSEYISAGAYNQEASAYLPSNSVWYYTDVIYSGISATSFTTDLYNTLYSTPLVTLSPAVNPLSSSSTFYFGLPTGNGNATGQTIYFNFGRIRAYPPNGTAPTNTFGGITQNAIIVNINYATESETYSIITNINNTINYNELETETIIQTLTSGSLVLPITYATESETYSIPTKINNLTIQYNELEQYKLEAQADIIIHYSNASNELVGFVYGIVIVYNSNSSYSILENNVIGDKNGNFINDLYLYIQPSASTYIPFANYSITSKYLPPNTNVTSVTTSNTIKVNFGFTYTSISSWDSTTSVVTATITDSASNPIPNILVSWTSDGTSTTTPTSAITNASGVATTTIGTAGSTITGSTTIFNLTIVSSILT